jgi:hypothetical protein
VAVFILVHGPAFHNERDALQGSNIFQGIAVNGDNISELALLDGAVCNVS